jgi:hypothetical protein
MLSWLPVLSHLAFSSTGRDEAHLLDDLVMTIRKQLANHSDKYA